MTQPVKMSKLRSVLSLFSMLMNYGHWAQARGLVSTSGLPAFVPANLMQCSVGSSRDNRDSERSSAYILMNKFNR